MKLRYWGTAAAEGIPAIFCDCAVCRYAWAHGGREIRTRSQAIVDDRLLIDLNPDSFTHAIQNQVHLGLIHHLLITHTHNDHFAPKELSYRMDHDYAHLDPADGPLHIYGSATVGEIVRNLRVHNSRQPADNMIEFHEIRPFESFSVFGYRVVAYPARHDPSSGPLMYQITDRTGRTMLYGHDSGPYFDEVWTAMKQSGVQLNFVSMDCTEGDRDMAYDAHCNLARDIAIRDRMRAEQIAAPDAVFCLNHFSHNGGHVNYAEFSPIAEAQGFRVAYDSMEVEI